jgi:hypothetical protein
MAYSYPAPRDVGIRIPGSLIEARFVQGFRHALAGGQLCAVEHLRLSFREGFRAGKCYARELRRARGVLDFPMFAQVKAVARPRYTGPQRGAMNPGTRAGRRLRKGR